MKSNKNPWKSNENHGNVKTIYANPMNIKTNQRKSTQICTNNNNLGKSTRINPKSTKISEHQQTSTKTMENEFHLESS